MFAKTLFAIALLTTASAEEANSNDDQIYLRGGDRRELFEYEAPLWYARMEDEDTTGTLRRCMRRENTPANGEHCGASEKLCFFETQDCDGVGAHPLKRCHCDGEDGNQQWSCTDEQCPIYPDPARTGCAPEDEEVDHGNDPLCPNDSPLGAGTSTCSSDQDKLQCHYGTESCCGQCYAEDGCHCNSEYGWECYFMDKCLLSACSTTDWPLEGSTCIEARTAIFAEFPGMTVICQKESEPDPAEDDMNRYIVYTDESGLVTTVVYNRNAPCPVEKTDSCDVDGQQCSWNSETETDSTTCTMTEKCTCTFGIYECEVDESCSS